MDSATPREADAIQQIGKPQYVHTLSLRLTDQHYRALRRFVAAQEDRFGRRLTHQAVLEAALHQLLEKHRDAKP